MNVMIEWISNPWPWYVGGPLIGITMFILLYLGKSFGFSSNLRTLCTMCGADKTSDFFKIDIKAQRWNLLFLVGAIFGGFIASHFLSNDGGQIPEINPYTAQHLQSIGFESTGTSYVPLELYGNEALQSPFAIILLLIGGLLAGFGSRYAGGCTSGHSISGISNFQLPSLIATIGFFIGGLIMVHFIFPFLF